MSNHKISVDIQKVALAMQVIRVQLDILEDIIQEALTKENKHE